MKLYNTLSRKIENFTNSDDVVKMYVCGITPYSPSHIGHAMSAVVFDTLRRHLQYVGYKVRLVQN
ncbi:MAG: cysteine--tRNA ligase, partial [Anaerolineales bacterium]|nr:cysteine--tRNA ligase [Anaerolineales bacterium]